VLVTARPAMMWSIFFMPGSYHAAPALPRAY
jgi:hypothetical protein